MTEKETPKVSVCMITYNHEPYIAQAIEGVLMQETDFPYELVIGEDCSTDNTRKICEDYAKRFPDKIRLLESVSNLGIVPNLLRTIEHSKGIYIAFCEGDDYWIAKDKLLRQVAFLESNRNFSGVCSAARRLYQQTASMENDRLFGTLSEGASLDLTPKELISDFMVYTPSMMIRKSCLSHEKLKGLSFADKFIQLLVSSRGPMRYFNRLEVVYRIHPGGAMHTLIPANPELFFSDYCRFLESFNVDTDLKYNDEIEKARKRLLSLGVLSKPSTSLLKRSQKIIELAKNDVANGRQLKEVRNYFSLAFPRLRSLFRSSKRIVTRSE